MIKRRFKYCYIKWNILIKFNQRICTIMITFRFLLLISFKLSIKYYLKLLRNEIIISLFEKSEKFVYPKIKIPPKIKKFGFLDIEVFSEFDWLIFFLYPNLYPHLYPNLYLNLGKFPPYDWAIYSISEIYDLNVVP